MILVRMTMHHQHVELLSRPSIHRCPPLIAHIPSTSRTPSSLFHPFFPFLSSAHSSSSSHLDTAFLSSPFYPFSKLTSCFLSSSAFTPHILIKLFQSFLCHSCVYSFFDYSSPYLSVPSLLSCSVPLVINQSSD